MGLLGHKVVFLHLIMCLTLKIWEKNIFPTLWLLILLFVNEQHPLLRVSVTELMHFIYR